VKKVILKINGRSRQVVTGPEMLLIDLLREGHRLTSVKQSCDRKGQCGTCTVLVNGKATLACLTKVAKLEGAEIVTSEGLGIPDNPHLIQEAYVLSGAIQCGFCTPGLVMATKALLGVNPDPSTEEIRKAFRRNLCRCTGYVKIIEAVKLAGRFLRGELRPDDIRPKPTDAALGVSHPRPSAMVKACGVAEFTGDIDLPGALELVAVRSPHAHAVIKSIDTSAAEKMPGVVGVITAKDIKGTNRLKYVVGDRPVLCDDKVRQLGDAVAAVAAATREQALAAAEMVKVEYQVLPVMSSPKEAMAAGAPQIHPDRPNVCYVQPVVKGDAAAGFAKAAAVAEGRFKTQINHQAPLEPEASVAFLEGEDDDPVLVIIGRSINIHGSMAILQQALGHENMRYEEAYSGGQFGLKLEVVTEGIAGAAALRFKRPIRYIPSLAESILITSKRHAFDTTIKLGADAQGKLTAMAMDIVVDNGAYQSIGDVILRRALHMLSSSYFVPDLDVMSKLVYTNNPWGSAARGAGPPQTHFALECAMDMLAEKLKIDPLELRRRNSLLTGQTKATGYVVQDVWPFPELCDEIRPHYQRAKQERSAHRSGTLRRGVGLGAAAFGIGQPADKAAAVAELDPDDCVTVYAAAADPGEGNDSMLSQLAAQVMELPLNKIRVVTRDTDRTAASGPASGSRITYMVGGAAVDALQKLRKATDEVGAISHRALKEAGKPTRYMGEKKILETASLDPKTGQGPSFESNVHAIQMAEVEVNTETGEVKMLRMMTAVDAGPIINPQNLTGQLEGGMDMGAGFALREEHIAGKTKDWVTFKFPTMRTSFDMEVITRQTPRIRGTLGATGVGEMSMVSTAPAIINAIHDACGIWIHDLPATPDNLAFNGLLRPGDHVVSTRLEHNSVLRPLHHFRERGWIEFDLVAFDGRGFVDPDDIVRCLRPNTRAVVVSHVSNVLGTVQPVPQIGRLCAQRGIPLIVDASQGAGVVPIDLAAWKASAVAFTGHKALHGPTGIGGLVLHPDLDLQPSRFGGTGVDSRSPAQTPTFPHRLEAGTLNLMGILGLAAGVEFVAQQGLESIHRQEMALLTRLRDGLAELAQVETYCAESLTGHVPVLTVNVKDVHPEDVGAILDADFGIAVRVGLHCAPLVHQQLGTLQRGAVRFSLGLFNTADEIDRAVSALASIPGRS
jgi:aldehyde oxidoreductase